MAGARIGKNCRIFPGAVIAAMPQDLKFAGEKTTVHIGDNTVIRECVTVNRGTVDRLKTVVGANCLLMAYVHVAHDCIIGDNCVLANSVQLAGHVEIGAHAIIGGTSAVHQFVKVGPHAMISGGSLVRKDVPPFVKAGREPLTYSGINSIGLRRRGFSDQKISEIQQLYRLLFLGGMNNNDALDKIELELAPSPERDEVVNFVRNSGRGIIKGYSRGGNGAD
jgi:UDP-N-acetylglucosamine acyltransferase